MVTVMDNKKRFSSGYASVFHPNYDHDIETMAESEELGSSGRVDTDITASEDSSVPQRKCISLNSEKKREMFGVPVHVLPLSSMSPSERKDLVSRLRAELEQIRLLQKKVDLQRTHGLTVSSSSDILSFSKAQNGYAADNLWKKSPKNSRSDKKVNTKVHKEPGWNKKVNTQGHKAPGWKRSASGRFESDKEAAGPSTSKVILMKQCETLLKRLMSHQYGHVFNAPVDPVKLKIPDYFDIIKNPMDLGTIKSKIAEGSYSSPLDFLADVRLTFSNAKTYNPTGNDVHFMAETLSKFFESRWKPIEKKLTTTEAPEKLRTIGENGSLRSGPPFKKRKISSGNQNIMAEHVLSEPVKWKMTDEERHNLGRELEALIGEMPMHIINFLKEHSSNGKETGEDEIEIDIDDLSEDTLLTLRKLLDEYLQERVKKHAKAEPCEIELLNESGLSNSSMQMCKGNDPVDEDVDIGGNEPPVSSYPQVETEKDKGFSSKHVSSGNSSDNAGSNSVSSSEHKPGRTKVSAPANLSKVLANTLLSSSEEIDKRTRDGDLSDVNREGASTERQVSPEKLYRAALLKHRFADTILKVREKPLGQGESVDPDKLQREKEELEMQRKKEKARLQAEAKAAEEARRRADEKAAAEGKLKRELEREAARQALLKMEKTVEINENSRFLEDLEMLRAAPAEQIPSSMDETSPSHSQDGLGTFKFGGGSNPLEQLGLYMKVDDEEEDAEPPPFPSSEFTNEVEEGEID